VKYLDAFPTMNPPPPHTDQIKAYILSNWQGGYFSLNSLLDCPELQGCIEDDIRPAAEWLASNEPDSFILDVRYWCPDFHLIRQESDRLADDYTYVYCEDCGLNYPRNQISEDILIKPLGIEKRLVLPKDEQAYIEAVTQALKIGSVSREQALRIADAVLKVGRAKP
jgi:hypothetical protein